jgi:hypothetical protein
VSKIELAPLPKPWIKGGVLHTPLEGVFTATQMRSYAEQEVARERERSRMACHDAVCKALNEAGVRNEVLRGMCIEVAMETFLDLVAVKRVSKGTEA